MVPLGDEAQVESRVGLSDVVLILTRGLRQTYHRLGNRFGRT